MNRTSHSILVVGLAILPWTPDVAMATCNQIPGAVGSFRGTLGSLDRPFATPGAFVTVMLSSACDSESPGLSADASDHVITIGFDPPNGAQSVVFLAPGCTAIEDERSACESRDEVGTAVCLPQQRGDVEVFERNGERRLRFRFPDTDALIDEANDDRTLTGPATIAVSRRGAALPCGPTSGACSEHTGLIACVGELFRIDGTCDPNPHEEFNRFTALPPPNNFQALCIEPAAICSPAPNAEVRFTIDADGNMLVPMDWRGILPEPDLPPARLVRGQLAIEAFPGSGAPIRVPNDLFVRSFSPEGLLLAPIFQPQVSPEGSDDTILFGSADGPESILWIARKRPSGRRCADDPLTSCFFDSDCPAGECGIPLFDFSTRLEDGVGPITVSRFGPGICQNDGAPCMSDDECGESRCVAFRLTAEQTVPLDGLIETPSTLVSIVPEPIEGRDLNGDGDLLDDVLTLMNRDTGERQPIGVAGADGRAATRIFAPPFGFPAVATEGDVVAFLEAEPKQFYADANEDGDVFDTILRVYRSTGQATEDLAQGLNPTADAAPMIDDRTIVVSEGLVFFRTREAAAARYRARRVSVASNGAQADDESHRPAISADGRFVAFESSASNIADGADGETRGFIHDLATEQTVLIRVESAALAEEARGLTPSLSGDGRYVATSALADDGREHIFVLDRDADSDGILDEPGETRTVLIDRNPATLEPGDGDAFLPAVSSDGRFVTYVSEAGDLLVGEESFPNRALRAWVTDRDPDGNGVFDELDPVFNRVGEQSFFSSVRESPVVSADGRWLAFATFQDLGDTDDDQLCTQGVSCPDVVVSDLESSLFPQPIAMSVKVDGGSTGNAPSLATSMSGNARYVAFVSLSTDLIAGDTNGVGDAFVRDRVAQQTHRISVSSDGQQGDGPTFGRQVSMSADGRFIAFSSIAANLVPDDGNDLCDNDFDGAADDNCSDVFVHDRWTGFTRRASASVDGGDPNSASKFPSLSASGSIVAFESSASNLVSGDDNDFCDDDPDDASAGNCSDVFVAEPDAEDSAPDLNGDGDLDDTLLAVFDVAARENPVRILFPATRVAVAAGRAVFLAPEREQGSDLNGDGDLDDEVVHFYEGKGDEIRNLGVAATGVALGRSWLAALVEADGADSVVYVAPVAHPESWTSLGRSGNRVAVADRFVAFTTPDSDGRNFGEAGGVLQLYDAVSKVFLPIDLKVEEFVLGPELLAFRVVEEEADLNGDGDTRDAVMHVYDTVGRRLLNTGQAATPCRFAVCDPRVPYRVAGRTVKFLTVEEEQGEDLDGDRDTDGVVLQTFDARHVFGEMAEISTARPAIRASTATRVVGAVSVGVCTDTGLACATDQNCPDGRCHVPPGFCIADVGAPCLVTGANTCGQDQFCVPKLEQQGTCHQRLGECSSDADCVAPARCRAARTSFGRVANPLSSVAAGEHLFVGNGRCVEDTRIACSGLRQVDDACSSGEFCVDNHGGGPTCRREHGVCRTDDDCPGVATCERTLILAAAGDQDADGAPDPLDNCPDVANADQVDSNDNGVGDACDASLVASSPTATMTPSITATPTATSAATPSVPPNPTETSTTMPTRSGHDDDGCAINPGDDSHASGLALVFVLLVLIRGTMMGRKRKVPPIRDGGGSSGPLPRERDCRSSQQAFSLVARVWD